MFVTTALLYYSFDTSTIYGSTVTNLGSGGSAYNAVLMNGATITNAVADKVVGSSAVKLSSASSQYIQIPPFQTGSNGVTVAFWFKFSGSSTNSHAFDFGNGKIVNNLLFILQSSGDCSLLGYHNSTQTSKSSVFNQVVNDGVWRHAAWTIDYNGNWIAYLNGQQTTSALNLYYPSAITRSYNFLGKSNSGSDPYMNGGIDEFYMFQNVLTAPQVLELYQRKTV